MGRDGRRVMATVQGAGRGARWYCTTEAVCTWTWSEARWAMWGAMVLAGLMQEEEEVVLAVVVVAAAAAPLGEGDPCG